MIHHRPATTSFPCEPRLRSGLATSSGGLVYHLRALRYRSLWSPFAWTVAEWMSEWRPPCSRLVIVGPSAGYCLPAGFLAAFGKITALEPDPLARWLLGRRFPSVSWNFEHLDCLSREDGLAMLDARFPDAAFLFSNVLGQVAAPGGRTWSALLSRHLGHRHWASWHDAVSTPVPPRRQQPCQLSQPAVLEEVLARFWAGGELPLTDHQTFGLGGSGQHGYAIWQLQPAGYHLVEWCAHRPASPARPQQNNQNPIRE